MSETILERAHAFFKNPERCRQEYREAWAIGKAVYDDRATQKAQAEADVEALQRGKKFVMDERDAFALALKDAREAVLTWKEFFESDRGGRGVSSFDRFCWFKGNLALARTSSPTALLEAHDKDRPEIICFCGSSRFISEMAVLMWEFEKEGKMSLGLHLLPQGYPGLKAHHQAEAEGIADKMDALHLKKIDISDRVFVVNIGGYIGDSTKREIAYAKKIGKPVSYLETAAALRPSNEAGKKT